MVYRECASFVFSLRCGFCFDFFLLFPRFLRFSEVELALKPNHVPKKPIENHNGDHVKNAEEMPIAITNESMASLNKPYMLLFDSISNRLFELPRVISKYMLTIRSKNSKNPTIPR